MTTTTEIDVDRFRADGYLLPGRQLFAPEKLDALEAIFTEHLADKGSKLSDELDTPHFRDPRLLDFLLSDEVLDTVEPLVGPDIALWTSHFISKDPFTGRATPWHEDSAFWNGRFDRYDSIVTVWLALGPSNRSNGCMRVIPGSHLEGGSTTTTCRPTRACRPSTPRSPTWTRARPSTSSSSGVSSRCTTGGSCTGRRRTRARCAGPGTPCATSRRR